MKKYSFYTIALLLVTSFYSCVKDESAEPVTIIDPSPWYSYSANWEEQERKIGTGNWVQVQPKNVLNLSWDIEASTANKIGAYKYNPSGLSLQIDTAGYMQIKGEVLSFITVKAGTPLTTATVQFLLSGDTSLIIRNTTSVPTVEMKYKKSK